MQTIVEAIGAVVAQAQLCEFGTRRATGGHVHLPGHARLLSSAMMRRR